MLGPRCSTDQSKGARMHRHQAAPASASMTSWRANLESTRAPTAPMHCCLPTCPLSGQLGDATPRRPPLFALSIYLRLACSNRPKECDPIRTTPSGRRGRIGCIMALRPSRLRGGPSGGREGQFVSIAPARPLQASRAASSHSSGSPDN